MVFSLRPEEAVLLDSKNLSLENKYFLYFESLTI